MKKYVLNTILCLISSAQLVCLAQDTTKAAGAKPADKPAVPAVKPAEKATEAKTTEKATDKPEEKNQQTACPATMASWD